MRLNTKSIADRLCDEGFLECLSDYILEDPPAYIPDFLTETTLRSKVVSFLILEYDQYLGATFRLRLIKLGATCKVATYKKLGATFRLRPLNFSFASFLFAASNSR